MAVATVRAGQAPARHYHEGDDFTYDEGEARRVAGGGR